MSGATGTETYVYDGDGALRRRTTAPPTYVPPYAEDFQTANSGWSTSGAVAWGVYDNASHTSTVRATGASSWIPVIARTASIADGQVARVAFKLGQTNSQAGLELDTGSGSGYYRVAVYEAGGKLYQALAYPSGGGTTYVNPTVLVDAFQANTWYVLEVTANDGAGSRVSVWAESAPNTRYEARWGMPTGQAWTFRGWVYTTGTMLWLDTYREEPPSVKVSDVRYAGQHYEDDRGPTPSVTKRYYAEGKLLATRTGALLTYVQSDHLGSTSTLTDAGGSVVARERYSAFGERRRGETPLTTDQLYTSQQYNSLSGLYHYSDGKSAGRFYDPLLARFVQPDSITPGKGSIALNRYAYANDSPIMFSDPTGHAVWSEKDGPAYETHEQLIDAVGAYDAPSEVRWTGIYSEAYPNYAPPMSEPDRNYGYRLKVWQWQTQKEADAAQASGAGADWSKVGSNLLTGVSLAAGVVASNGGDDGGLGEGKTGISQGSYVYRGLAETDVPEWGLQARVPDAGNSPVSHIAGKRESQWISTSKSLEVAREKYGKFGVVEIDLSKVSTEVVDLSQGIPGVRGRISNWAKRDREVLIQNYIPPEAIRRLLP